ncbi:hypothetical protein J2Z35_002742 [Acetoanaerobium pronyense]|uniref:Uncharacterized protein n=1 Tax=Acetoanaerobium pronyense TaxID=1482736 RepID=A0ABS4KM92_9FIRM|nr:hypothetical protein [Acetoanaerobium pronyense]MBP2028904.1 hypothetical protein [Acetoanaerobium pronyense]
MYKLNIKGQELTLKIAEFLLSEDELKDFLDFLQKDMGDSVLNMNGKQDYMIVDEKKNKTYILRKKDNEVTVMGIMDKDELFKK